ncbi:MAG: ATP-grasp domain-containing protein, partial [Bacilli bacterium]|nr:ATP-grasp domain-containing protein [Bacilli bacterium]
SKYMYFTRYNDTYLYQDLTLSYADILDTINKALTYPIFVKPANSGSSIGITKVSKSSELSEAIEAALKIDNRILIEEGIKGREVECGILEKEGEIIASCVGEIIYQDSFYSFDAKYNDASSVTVIPANLDADLAKKVQEQAIKVFKILNCHGYSRCDFFIEDDNTILLNEINTIPVFTEISMYTKLFEES